MRVLSSTRKRTVWYNFRWTTVFGKGKCISGKHFGAALNNNPSALKLLIKISIYLFYYREKEYNFDDVENDVGFIYTTRSVK